MFWSGNYIAVRELNSLLKEENVTLSQVLEADDVLQECKADNKVLIQFLTRPDILAELVTLITEEPPKNVELSLQYRHATIACEVLTSQLPTLSDRLSMDTAQMHRLCDFINKEPPLNPLLASYFSKTIEMLLDRNPKQDWYLYHIVCLRVLDFLKARRDFLPNLLRHLHTSAVLDALKCFIRLNDLFNKLIMEWLEEHQFLESLIAIICGTYEPPRAEPEREKGLHELSEKAEREAPEKSDEGKPDKEVNEGPPASEQATGDAEAEADAQAERAADRVRAVAAANAAALLIDIILNGCAAEYSQVSPAGNARSRTALALVARATSPSGVGALLQGMFTSPAPARRHALVHGARVLLAMRRADQEEVEAEHSHRVARGGVELAVAPHLPLLHTALLQPPEPYDHAPSAWEAPTDGGGGAGDEAAAPAAADVATTREVTAVTTEVTSGSTEAAPGSTDVAPGPTEVTVVTTEVPPGGSAPDPPAEPPAGPPPAPYAPPAAPAPPAARVAVGAARLQVAALLAALCGSEVDEVASTMLTLGTPGVLIDMFFAHPDNNFLHAQVLAMVRHALDNRAYRTQYARHILEECDLFNRLMDVYEENENKSSGSRPRAGYMGHAVLLLRALAPLLDERTPAQQRWASSSIHQLITRLDTPLGGYYPSENTYEVEAEGMVEVETRLYNLSNYSDFVTDEALNEVSSSANMNKFLELSNQRMCNQSDMWDDAPEGEAAELERSEQRERGADRDDDQGEAGEAARATVRDVLAPASPWESAFDDNAMSGEGWAQFSADAFGSPADPFAGDAFPKSAYNNDAFANTDGFTNVSSAKDFDFKSDAFANDAFASDAFTKRGRFDGAPAFADDSFGEGAASEEFTPFWGYQDKADDVNGSCGVEQGLRGMSLRALDKPLDALSSSLADNLRTAMSSMTPEVIANIVNANMTPALDVPLTDAPNTNTEASNTNTEVSNTNTEASNTNTEASNTNTEASNTNTEASNTNTEASNTNTEASNTNTEASNTNTEASNTNTEASNSAKATSTAAKTTSTVTVDSGTTKTSEKVSDSESKKEPAAES